MQSTGFSSLHRWIDADHDGCNIRAEVLRSEVSITPKAGERCALSGGEWFSAYDNTYIDDARGSMLGFLLYTDDQDNLGALNLYSHKPGAFTDDSETAGWLLASHAAVAISGAREHAGLQHAIDTRHTIGQAMGILMAQHHIDEDEAFQVLRRYSQEKNIKPREVARQLSEHATL